MTGELKSTNHIGYLTLSCRSEGKAARGPCFVALKSAKAGDGR
jgi:hypothetical protein